MKAPPIFIVVRTTGDGYSHDSHEYVAWFFDESDASEFSKAQPRPDHGGTWFSVERVEAAEPMPEKPRW